jgi:hypothetical protein
MTAGCLFEILSFPPAVVDYAELLSAGMLRTVMFQDTNAHSGCHISQYGEDRVCDLGLPAKQVELSIRRLLLKFTIEHGSLRSIFLTSLLIVS